MMLSRPISGILASASNIPDSSTQDVEGQIKRSKSRISVSARERFEPFLDGCLAPVERSIYEQFPQFHPDSIHIHPNHADRYLVPPVCTRCRQQKVLCDRAPGSCNRCRKASVPCLKKGSWMAIQARKRASLGMNETTAGGEIEEKMVSSDKAFDTLTRSDRQDKRCKLQAPLVSEEASNANSALICHDSRLIGAFPTIDPNELRAKQHDLPISTPSLWSSDLRDMHFSDPLFPPPNRNVKLSRGGIARSILIDYSFLKPFEYVDTQLCIAIVAADTKSFQGVKLAAEFNQAIDVYWQQNQSYKGIRFPVHMAENLCVAHLGRFQISNIKGDGARPPETAFFSLSLKSQNRVDGLIRQAWFLKKLDQVISDRKNAKANYVKPMDSESDAVFIPPSIIQPSGLFKVFHCSNCGKLYSTQTWNTWHCDFCKVNVAIQDPYLREGACPIKMELVFSGQRADQGRATFIQTQNSVLERVSKIWSDGLRTCTYILAEVSSSSSSSAAFPSCTNVASISSKKPIELYHVLCADRETIDAGDWINRLLRDTPCPMRHTNSAGVLMDAFTSAFTPEGSENSLASLIPTLQHGEESVADSMIELLNKLNNEVSRVAFTDYDNSLNKQQRFTRSLLVISRKLKLIISRQVLKNNISHLGIHSLGCASQVVISSINPPLPYDKHQKLTSNDSSEKSESKSSKIQKPDHGEKGIIASIWLTSGDCLNVHRDFFYHYEITMTSNGLSAWILAQ